MKKKKVMFSDTVTVYFIPAEEERKETWEIDNERFKRKIYLFSFRKKISFN